MLNLKKFTLVLFSLNLVACVITPIKADARNPKLSQCTVLPNCAFTEARSNAHFISPFNLAMTIENAWPIIIDQVSKLSGTSVIESRKGYIFAKSYSKIFGFVDYVEVLFMEDENRLSVRSSSLWGISDLGVNATRTEMLRESLKKKGVIH